jgi:hypothetical protein
MLHTTRNANSYRWAAEKRDLVLFEIDACILLDERTRFCWTDGIASSRSCRFCTNPDSFDEQYYSESCKMRYWIGNNSVKQQMMSEMQFFPVVPLKYVKNLYYFEVEHLRIVDRIIESLIQHGAKFDIPRLTEGNRDEYWF